MGVSLRGGEWVVCDMSKPFSIVLDSVQAVARYDEVCSCMMKSAAADFIRQAAIRAARVQSDCPITFLPILRTLSLSYTLWSVYCSCTVK